MSSYERQESLKEALKEELPEGLKPDSLDMLLMYGPPLIIGFGGPAGSGKTTTAVGVKQYLDSIGRGFHEIKFPTKDTPWGDKLYKSLNYIEGAPDQHPRKGNNVLCTITKVDKRRKYAKVRIEGFEKTAIIEIPVRKRGRWYGIQGLALDLILEQKDEAERNGENLLEKIFRKGERMICKVEGTYFNGVIRVAPRRFKRSSLFKDAFYMLMNFWEKRGEIKRKNKEDQHVILDRGTVLELSVVPPKLMKTRAGTLLEEMLERFTDVGGWRVNISLVANPSEIESRIKRRKKIGVTEQPYEDRKKLRQIVGNLLRRHVRRKNKIESKKPQKIEIETPIEELIADYNSSAERWIVIDDDRQVDVLIDTGSKSEEEVIASTLGAIGLAELYLYTKV